MLAKRVEQRCARVELELARPFLEVKETLAMDGLSDTLAVILAPAPWALTAFGMEVTAAAAAPPINTSRRDISNLEGVMGLLAILCWRTCVSWAGPHTNRPRLQTSSLVDKTSLAALKAT